MQLSNPKFKKLGRAAQKRVSQKIRKLIHEGYDQDQAAAIAYKYERAHMIGPRGGRAVAASGGLKSRKAASARGKKRNPFSSINNFISDLKEYLRENGQEVIDIQSEYNEPYEHKGIARPEHWLIDVTLSDEFIANTTFKRETKLGDVTSSAWFKDFVSPSISNHGLNVISARRVRSRVPNVSILEMELTPHEWGPKIERKRNPQYDERTKGAIIVLTILMLIKQDHTDIVSASHLEVFIKPMIRDGLITKNFEITVEGQRTYKELMNDPEIKQAAAKTVHLTLKKMAKNPSYADIPDEVMELVVSVGKPDKVLKDMYAWPESTIMIFVEPRNEVEVTRLLNKHGFVVFDKLKSKGRPAILVVSKNRFGKNPIKDNEIAKCLAALAGMINHPDRCEDIEEPILDALESEGLWNVDEGVTKKGKQFLLDAGWEESDEFYD